MNIRNVRRMPVELPRQLLLPLDAKPAEGGSKATGRAASAVHTSHSASGWGTWAYWIGRPCRDRPVNRGQGVFRSGSKWAGGAHRTARPNYRAGRSRFGVLVFAARPSHC